jgi:monoamine oxidase
MSMPAPRPINHVVIIGAGAAGLAAWHGLRAAGVSAELVEARDRIGGRMWTIRSRESGPVELGAEFVHGKPHATFSVLRRAGIEPVECLDTRLFGEHGILREFKDFWEIIERVDSQIDRGREISYAEFLESAHATNFEKKIAKSYVEGFNAARAEWISAPSIALEDAASAEIEGEKQFRLPDGYASLTAWLGAAIPPARLHLRTVVRDVRWKRGEVEVTAETPSGSTTFRGNKLLITVPLGVLCCDPDREGALRIVPSLDEKVEAANRLETGHVVKVVFVFREPFWPVGKMGFAMKPDAEVATWWTQPPPGERTLTGWAGGPAAERLLQFPREEIIERALHSLAEIFGASFRDLRSLVEESHFHNWTSDPFSRGAYSYPKPGGIEAARVLARPVEDTLFFAGEATDANGRNGTVDGALASGARAANEIAGSLLEQTHGESLPGL